MVLAKFIELEKCTLTTADSVDLKMINNSSMPSLNLMLTFNRETLANNYFLTLPPGTVHSVYSQVNNDTLQFNFNTNKFTDYGNLFFNVEFDKVNNYIFQLLNSDEEIVDELYLSSNEKIVFISLT